MRRVVILLSATMLTLLPWSGTVGQASAATTSVKGNGSYERLVLQNRAGPVVLKMFTPGGECAIRYIQAALRDRAGTRYVVAGGCYGSGEWVASLSKGRDLVECPRLKLTYNADKGFWKAVVPRGCLRGLANRIKVPFSFVDDRSPNDDNEAGPTRYVARG
jgi:hypothetical protein